MFDIKLFLILSFNMHLPLILNPLFRRIYCYFKRRLNNCYQCYFKNWCDYSDTCYYNSKTLIDISGYRSHSYDKFHIFTSLLILLFCAILSIVEVLIFYGS